MRITAERWRRLTGPCLMVLAAMVATAPILMHGTYCGDDFEFHAVGWFDVQQSWLHGVLYPHWMPSANYGAGEPRFMFYPPLTWMLGAALGLVLPWGLVPVAMVFLFLAGTGLAVRRLALERLEDAPATLAGCAALFSGFALFTAYERTAFAELTGGFWIPLMLVYALRTTTPNGRRFFNGTTAALALLLAGAWLSNGPVGVMASYLLCGLAVIAAAWERSWAPFWRGCAAAGLGIGLAGYSLIPAAWEQRWVDLRAAVDYPVFRVENNWLFARHTDLLLAPFGAVLFKASMIAVAMVGMALGCAAVVFLRGVLRQRAGTGSKELMYWLKPLPFTGRAIPQALKAGEKGADRWERSADRFTWSHLAGLVFTGEDRRLRWWVLLAVIPVVVLLLQLPVSLPVWNLLPKLRFLQYPWRWVLAVEAPMGIFFAAAVWPSRTAKRGSRIAMGALCVGLFLGATLVAGKSFLRACGEGDNIADLLEQYRAGGGFEGTDEYEPPGTDHWQLAKGLPDACLSDDSDTELGVLPAGSQTPEWDAAQGGCVETFRAAVRGPEGMRFGMDVPRAGFLILRLVRYPAWRVRVNGRPVAEMPERDDGLMAVPVPSGPVELRVEWVSTADVVAGRWVSGVSVLLLLGLVCISSGAGWAMIGRTPKGRKAGPALGLPRLGEDA